MINLNKEQLIDDGHLAPIYDDPYGRPYYTRNHSVSSGYITVHFDGLEDALVREIEQSDVVFGCVAWLTNSKILSALASKDVSIVVQKEDFLRPDMFSLPDWKSNLRKQYDALKCSLERPSFSPLLSCLNQCGDYSVSPIRCAGNYNREKSPAFPRMHHKFVVFSKIVGRDGMGFDILDPYAVWTGSFNVFRKRVGYS
jgi:hypothetical protein